jgi:replicative DNA helicase
MSEKSLPIEKTILSSMISSETALEQGLEKLKPDMFSTKNYFDIFSCISYLTSKKISVSIVTIVDSIPDIITDITDIAMTASVSNIESHIKILTKYYMKRCINSLVNKVNSTNLNPDTEPEEVMSVFEKEMNAINAYSVTSIKHVRDVLLETWQEIEDSANGKNGKILTGIRDFDSLVGLFPGDMFVIGARPSAGKTAIALTIAINVALSGNAVFLATLEMKNTRIMKRMLANLSEVELDLIRNGDINGVQYKLTDASNKLYKTNIYFDDRAKMNAFDFRSSVLRLKKNNDIKIAIIDYLQFMHPIGKKAIREEMNDTSQIIKSTAKDANIPIIVLSQLSRNCENRKDKPVMSDLKESGNIEQDADIVGLLNRPSLYDKEIDKKLIELKIAKNRDGKTGSINLIFEGIWQKFFDETFDNERIRENYETF